MATLSLNERALKLADQMAANAGTLRVAVATTSAGARIIDCGVSMDGGLQAGLMMARVLMADLAEVALAPTELMGFPAAQVQVATDFPVQACMASQYAGWEVKVGNSFAMGSGPMRALLGKEKLFDDIGYREQGSAAVGALETSEAPERSMIAHISEALKIQSNKLTLLIAPPSSQAGTVQVVARCLETALHKLHVLKFDLKQIVSGMATAPLPPVGKTHAQAFGRPNDAILYGGRVILWVRGDDDQLAKLGPSVPSSASKDYGRLFTDIMGGGIQELSKIDPLLFSPAMIVFHNLKTGRTHGFGRVNHEVLLQSFFG